MIWSHAIDNIGKAVDFFNQNPGDLSNLDEEIRRASIRIDKAQREKTRRSGSRQSTWKR